jgi:hypothetical protein
MSNINYWRKKEKLIKKFKKINELRLKKDNEKRLKRNANKRRIKNKEIEDIKKSEEKLRQIEIEKNKKDSIETIENDDLKRIEKINKNKNIASTINFLFNIDNTSYISSLNNFAKGFLSVDDFLNENSVLIKELKSTCIIENDPLTRKEKDILISKIKYNKYKIQFQLKIIDNEVYYKKIKILSKIFKNNTIELELLRNKPKKINYCNKKNIIKKEVTNNNFIIDYNKCRISKLRSLCKDKEIKIIGNEGRLGYIKLLISHDSNN